MLEVGSSLGRYRIKSLLGSGGYGDVYVAVDTVIKRDVALKLLRTRGDVDSTRLVHRAMREARATAGTSHANAVVVYDVGEVEGQPFIAMELVLGESMRARIKQGGSSLAERLRWLRELAAALAAAHARGFVHRDVKPGNVMVRPDGTIKLLDFGVATRTLDENEPPCSIMTQEGGGVPGTRLYMAPEALAGAPPDPRSDQFAWGLVAYELLTGRRARAPTSDSPSSWEVYYRTPTPVHEVTPEVARAVSEIVARALSISPDERFASMDAIATALSERSHAGAGDGGRSETETETSAGTVRMDQAGTETRVSTTPSHPRADKAAGRRKPWAWALLLLTAVIVGVVALRPLARSPRDAAKPATPRATDAALGRVTLLDLPPPRAANHEAAVEYAAGMQSLHDNSWDRAREHFERVVLLDPTIALAHLRLGMVLNDSQDPRRREEFAKAVASRVQLDERDEALLEAVEPVLQRVADDPAEALARLERASARYPGDVEFIDWIGYLNAGDPTAALAASERAVALDPMDGMALQNKGDALVWLGRAREALDVFEACASLAVDSADCLTDKVRLEMTEGRCVEAETDARRVADRDPAQGGLVVAAMVAIGRPEGAIAEAIAQLERVETGPTGRFTAALHRIRGAALAGDLGAAERLAQDVAGMVASDPAKRSDYTWRYKTTLALVEILLEEGKDADARQEASEFIARSESWSNSTTRSFGVDAWPWLLRLTVGRGGPSQEEFEQRRALWAEGRLRGWRAYSGSVWPYAYAEPAMTPEEAGEALAALPKFSAPASFAYDDVPDAYVGHAYLLAGKSEDALPYLKRAVANCGVWYRLPKQMHAALELGQALETTRDTLGACAAYRVVIDRWGHAKPKSVTADKAKARAQALKCAVAAIDR